MLTSGHRYFYQFCRQAMSNMPLDFRPFRNSNLFSNHYLEKLIKESLVVYQ